jgi:hypothetical protein
LRAIGPATEALGDGVVADTTTVGSVLLEALDQAQPRLTWQQAVRTHCDPALTTRTILQAALS